MEHTILDTLSWTFLLIGGFFSIVGAIGVLRFPDMFSRMHGAGMIDTMGAGMILVGLMFQAGFTIVSIKLFLIIAFLFFTSPTTTHALARAALNAGIIPMTGIKSGKRPDAAKAKKARKKGSGSTPKPKETPSSKT
ncbi:monovalent cation/H(+) antiporter subunit G [Varunaivibrio sulfuroxidans]|uniref:Multisubunit sodium/proton antiporter MrpG subunit n=1 Tax=Varunaivibrio sulfuroxidans TaxID=1773489 RepID=A0A4R3JE60_9PROT|nr:monovalent cation/H(+) antiporter subunit G [Varunaivibrio sulfuroxidans]TCS64074.1 multisubunit sodium/proton antiporter MrpG subunit [Varunaivibrio sulfuroxidans]WES31475.1 monovalent cation/H(+) antiporter subunit G [Varunaivibrio sulfuroxidans]